MRNKIVLILLFVSNILCSAQSDSLYFFDYEKDTEWLQKLQNYKLSAAETKDVRINIQEVFELINENSDVIINYNSVISQYIHKYLSYKWLSKIFGLLKFYQPLFETKLAEYGLPLDLKYLAIVESNLNPQAGSWAGASGLWQFMPKTGQNYGLAKNSKINLFFDPYSSTDAACQYLSFLYKMFGDWNLVLSAYNSGQGTVLNAIKKAGTKNYWVVRQYLPDETKAYVPSFHAVRFVGKAYSLFFEFLPTLKYDYSQVGELTADKTTTFKEFAAENNLNLQQLYFLNPHIVTEIIPKGVFVYYLKN